jgi:hypothetical protein
MPSAIEERARLEREQTESQILQEFGVAPGQVYRDNSKRRHGRLFKVTSVTLKAGKATWILCDEQGNPLQETSNEKRLGARAIELSSIRGRPYTRIL